MDNRVLVVDYLAGKGNAGRKEGHFVQVNGEYQQPSATVAIGHGLESPNVVHKWLAGQNLSERAPTHRPGRISRGRPFTSHVARQPACPSSSTRSTRPVSPSWPNISRRSWSAPLPLRLAVLFLLQRLRHRRAALE